MNAIELDIRLAAENDTRDSFAAIEAMCKLASTEQMIWWACLCGWSIWRPSPPEDEDVSLAIASRWVFTADDVYRQQAANRLENESADVCKWLLKAVAHSGRSGAADCGSPHSVSGDVVGQFIQGFIHQLLSFRPTIARAAAAQTFVQIARQSIADPLPRSKQSTGSLTGHE